jgi:hypothetical protein
MAATSSDAYRHERNSIAQFKEKEAIPHPCLQDVIRLFQQCMCVELPSRMNLMSFLTVEPLTKVETPYHDNDLILTPIISPQT